MAKHLKLPTAKGVKVTKGRPIPTTGKLPPARVLKSDLAHLRKGISKGAPKGILGVRANLVLGSAAALKRKKRKTRKGRGR